MKLKCYAKLNVIYCPRTRIELTKKQSMSFWDFNSAWITSAILVHELAPFYGTVESEDDNQQQPGFIPIGIVCLKYLKNP
mmetsp:Transcript_8920/g.12276  ORF Transcript_8920/g.12276 Transcript_8920/m.12276 type:complete len:80 (+) Transcript_8920:24-263(+)